MNVAHTASHLVRRMLGFLGLAFFVFGVPYLLVRWGDWPFTSVPSLDEAWSARTRPVGDNVLFAATTVALWVIWGLFCIAVVIEFVTALAPRRGERGLGFRLPALGPIAGWLVASLLVTGSVTGAASRASARTLPPGRMHAAAAAAAPLEPALPLAPAAPVAVADLPVVAVERWQTAWAIAQAHLGDGMRWSEIWELNRGVPQADGWVWDDPDQLCEGWVLRLPADATNLPTAPTQRVHVVEEGESLWDIAAEELGDPYRYPDIAAANHDQITDPNLIFPEQELVLPPSVTEWVPPRETPVAPSPSPPPSVIPPPVTTVPPITTVMPTHPAPAPPAESVAEGGHTIGMPSPWILGVASGLLAAGLGTAYEIRRRGGRVRMRSGAPRREPCRDGLVADVHREIVLADVEHVLWVDVALRSLAVSLPRPVGVLPQLAEATDSTITLRLDRQSQPPAPWQPTGDGTLWTLDRKSAVPDPGDQPAPLPALVSLGVAKDDGRRVLLELESAGVIGLVGDDDATAAVARSWVLELATSPLADALTIFTVDFDVPGATSFPSLRQVSGLEAFHEIETTGEQARGLLASGRYNSTFAARASGRIFDGWPPLVVVIADPTEAARFAAVADNFGGGLGVAVVLVGTTAGLVVEASGDTLAIPSLDVSVTAQAVSLEVAEAVEEVLDEAVVPQPALAPSNGSAAQQTASDEFPAPGTPPQPLGLATPDGALHMPPEVLVRCLDVIDIDGARAKLTLQQVAAVAFLALHPRSTTETAVAALWPDGRDVRRRWPNLLTEIRSSLGVEHVPHEQDGRYQLGSGVAADVVIFDRLVARATAEPLQQQVATLSEALEFVTGPPFRYPERAEASFAWVSVGDWAWEWEQQIVTVAAYLARLCLHLGDPAGARRAAKRGRRAVIQNSELTELLMIATKLCDGSDAVTRVYEEHVASCHAMDLDGVEQSVVDCYHALCSKPRLMRLTDTPT